LESQALSGSLVSVHFLACKFLPEFYEADFSLFVGVSILAGFMCASAENLAQLKGRPRSLVLDRQPGCQSVVHDGREN
jgi:hypothetical protein